METRTRGLILALEFMLLLTAALVTLIDYKLKHDLLMMFTGIQSEISDTVPVPDVVPSGSVLDEPAGMAAADVHDGNGIAADARPARKRNVPKRSAGNGDTGVPERGEPVGS